MSSEDRETLPPSVDMGEPADLMLATVERLDRIASSLAGVSKELGAVARDLTITQQQQRTHGASIGALQSEVERLKGRVTDLEALRNG